MSIRKAWFKALAISFSLYFQQATSTDAAEADLNDVTLSKRMFPVFGTSSYQFEYVIPGELPNVDISTEKYSRKSIEANNEKRRKYDNFRKTLRVRRPDQFRRITSYYVKKQQELTSQLMAYDYRLHWINKKKEIFEALARQLEDLPTNYLAQHAVEAAKARKDLEYCHKYMDSVEVLHEKIEEYLAGKMYGPIEKHNKFSWVDNYLLLLRNEARTLTGEDVEYFDLLHKYNKIESYQREFINGRFRGEKKKSPLSQDRISHKIKKADLLLSVLLYGNPDSANELAAMRIAKEPVYTAKREKALASLAKAKSKEFAWIDAEGEANF